MPKMNSKSWDEGGGIKAHLYDDPSTDNLDLAELGFYLEANTPVESVDLREKLYRNFEGTRGALAGKFARARVRDPDTPQGDFEPLPGEIKFEEKLIRNPSNSISGVLYDGKELGKISGGLIPGEEMDISHFHVIFTNRLFGTWDEFDNRYHARVAVYGFPSLISTTGVVEAPAKPKEFYRKKREYARGGQTAAALEELKKEFKGRFIDYDDDRLTEVMKGYVMQALFYHLRTEPFCDKKECRLYNAHWQEEVIRAQLEPPEYCEKHERTIQKWRNLKKNGNP